MTPSPEQSKAELDAQLSALFTAAFRQPMQVSSTPGSSGDTLPPSHQRAADRIARELRRHVRDEDLVLSDHDFVMKAFERYKRYREEPLIDPNE